MKSVSFSRWTWLLMANVATVGARGHRDSVLRIYVDDL